MVCSSTATCTSSATLIGAHLLPLSGQHIPYVPSLSRCRLGRMHMLVQLLEDACMRAQQDVLAHLEHAQLSVLIPAVQRRCCFSRVPPSGMQTPNTAILHTLVLNRDRRGCSSLALSEHAQLSVLIPAVNRRGCFSQVPLVGMQNFSAAILHRLVQNRQRSRCTRLASFQHAQLSMPTPG